MVEGVAPGKLRLLVEAGNQLVALAENRRRWIMSQADRQEMLDRWAAAVVAAREELR